MIIKDPKSPFEEIFQRKKMCAITFIFGPIVDLISTETDNYAEMVTINIGGSKRGLETHPPSIFFQFHADFGEIYGQINRSRLAPPPL